MNPTFAYNMAYVCHAILQSEFWRGFAWGAALVALMAIAGLAAKVWRAR